MGPEMGPNLDGNGVWGLTIMGEAVWKKSRHPKGQREIDLQRYEWRGKDFPFHGVQEAAGSNPVTRTMRSDRIGSEYPTKDTPHFLLSKVG